MTSRLQDTAALAPNEPLPVRLTPQEPVLFDTGPMVRLFSDLGEAAAEDAVCRTLEEISHRLYQIDSDYSGAQFGALPRLAGEIAALSDQIGLCTVSIAARAVAGCAASGDSAALSATLARLGRVADRSMAEVWDIHDR